MNPRAPQTDPLAAHRPRETALRLVRDEAEPGHGAPVWRVASPGAARLAHARRRVLLENQAASLLDPDDARRILAARVAERLDGGHAAILTPENRRRILRIAHMLGVEPFDANLVIAIVQDGRRRGESGHRIARDPRLALVRAATRAQPRWNARAAAAQLVVAAALAIVAVAGLLAWVTM